ncbi:MAG TPA: zf-HC2 domain-containing protein [Candidatus Acidoferrum sp.]|nr:zf-HC2 domain-containing protein [Candidatus Acidoferrum sp.]
MSCERMESRILAYVDGRLKESERAEVQKHLDACPACRVRATEFSSVSSLLDELPMIEPSSAFDVRVRARIAAEPVKQSWWASWAGMRPSPRIAFAATLLLLATVFVSYRNDVPPPTMTQAEIDAGLNQDLSILEDHDTLSNFEPLKELPPPVDANNSDDDQQPM